MNAKIEGLTDAITHRYVRTCLVPIDAFVTLAISQKA